MAFPPTGHLDYYIPETIGETRGLFHGKNWLYTYNGGYYFHSATTKSKNYLSRFNILLDDQSPLSCRARPRMPGFLDNPEVLSPCPRDSNNGFFSSSLSLSLLGCLPAQQGSVVYLFTCWIYFWLSKGKLVSMITKYVCVQGMLCHISESLDVEEQSINTNDRARLALIENYRQTRIK